MLEVVNYPFPETNSKFASENSNAFRRLLLAARSGYEMLKVERVTQGKNSLKKPAINTKGVGLGKSDSTEVCQENNFNRNLCQVLVKLQRILKSSVSFWDKK